MTDTPPAIDIEGCDSVTITGNTFATNPEDAIHLEDCADPVIEDNTFGDTGDPTR